MYYCVHQYADYCDTYWYYQSEANFKNKLRRLLKVWHRLLKHPDVRHDNDDDDDIGFNLREALEEARNPAREGGYDFGEEGSFVWSEFTFDDFRAENNTSGRDDSSDDDMDEDEEDEDDEEDKEDKEDEEDEEDDRDMTEGSYTPAYTQDEVTAMYSAFWETPDEDGDDEEDDEDEEDEDDDTSACSCHLQEETAHQCDDCEYTYCQQCSLPDCEWCDHHRTPQNNCPSCNVSLNSFGQDVCGSCFLIGVATGDVLYCNTCETFVTNPSIFITDGNPCAEHDICVDVEVVEKHARDAHPALYACDLPTSPAPASVEADDTPSRV